MKYKLMVSDIDGTLVSQNKSLSDRTIQLVDEYQKMGGYFTLATGRMEKAIMPFLKQLHIDIPAIMYNGSSVVNINTGEMVFEARLNYDVAKTALKIGQQFDVDPLLYMDKSSYIHKKTPAIIKHEEKEKVECVEVGCLYEFLEVAPIKILFIGDEKRLELFAKQLQQETSAPLNLIYSEHNYLELLPVEASKGSALKKLAQYLHIPMDQVVAIGDERNDVSMVRAAGLGVAVKNAAPNLLHYADYVTQNECNQGVEEILYKLIHNIKIGNNPEY